MNEERKAPKIIVDDDWKERVQAEKEQLRRQNQEPDPSAADTSAGESAAAAPHSTDRTESDPTELPPASFAMLISALATQTLMAMGQLGEQEGAGAATTADLPLAKHHIDLLGMLQEKTSGNLTSEEAAMLENVLHELRMLFVVVSRG